MVAERILLLWKRSVKSFLRYRG